MRSRQRKFGALVLSVSLLLGSAPLSLADSSNARTSRSPLEFSHALIQTSLYTRHFSRKPEHTNNQQLIGLELHSTDRWLAGGARFKNSFNQATVYLYAGREFPFWTNGNGVTIRGKLTAGLLHGYRGEYRDKIPFNRFGIAPAALPSIGVRWGRLESDVILFGNAGFMLIAGLRF